MYVPNMHVLIIDDDVKKTYAIKRALDYNGIDNVVNVNNQEAAWNEIMKSINGDVKFDLIVTDMHYPLTIGSVPDESAGYKLIERLEDKKIDIPVVICSSVNWKSSNCLGSIWFSKQRDLNFDFKDLLEQLMKQH